MRDSAPENEQAARFSTMSEDEAFNLLRGLSGVFASALRGVDPRHHGVILDRVFREVVRNRAKFDPRRSQSSTPAHALAGYVIGAIRRVLG